MAHSLIFLPVRTPLPLGPLPNLLSLSFPQSLPPSNTVMWYLFPSSRMKSLNDRRVFDCLSHYKVPTTEEQQILMKRMNLGSNTHLQESYFGLQRIPVAAQTMTTCHFTEAGITGDDSIFSRPRSRGNGEAALPKPQSSDSVPKSKLCDK